MKSIGLSVILIVVSFGYTQAPGILWTKFYGLTATDRGWCVQQTLDGGYIVQGSTDSFGVGGTSIYLIKTDSLGDSLWTKTYQGGHCDVSYVQQTSDGGYIIIGTTDLFGSGGMDYYLVKTDAQGETLWTKTFGGSDDELGTDGQQTYDGGYVIVGWTESFTRQERNIYLIKTDSCGDSLWAKTYEGATGMPYFVQQTSDSGYIIAGQIASSTWPDIYLIKTDAQGDTLWTKTYGGAENDEAWDVQQTSDSCYIVVAATRSFGMGSWDFYLLKTDVHGDTLWTRTYGGYAGDASRSGQQTLDGGYIICGWTCSFTGYYDGYVVKTDQQGYILWQKAYGYWDQDEFQYIKQTSDGGYIAVGGTFWFGLGWDIWLVRTEPDVGVEEQPVAEPVETNRSVVATIFRGPLQLPENKKCRLFDITGRVVEPDKIQPGIYFIEVDGVVTQKVVRVR